MNVKDTMTQTAAAKILGVKPPTISVLIKRGTLKTVSTADGTTLLPVAEVERYKRQRRQPN